MAQHTPGPWYVHDFSEVPGFPNPSPADVTVSCDHPATITVANMDRALTATIDEARANARLIAAAPDMLLALRSVACALTDLGRVNRDGLTHKLVLEALAKAEGRL